MFWDRLRRKKRKFAVYLTRRGKVHPVGIFEASKPEELYNTIIEHIQKIEGVEAYTKIKIVDMETQQVIRIENPFAEPAEAGEEGSAGARQKRSTAFSINVEQLIDFMSSVQGKIIEAALDGAIKAFNKTNDLLVSVIVKRIESILSTLSPSAQQQKETTEDELMKLLLMMLGTRIPLQTQQIQSEAQGEGQ